MFFKDTIGQEAVKKRLIRSVQEERVSHAQLFSGPEGTGKLGLALAYAQYISCHKRTGTDSCGTCPACHKYSKLAHPDLHFVFPVFNSPDIKNPVSDDFLKEWREMIGISPYFNLSQWLARINAGNAQGSIYERESDMIYRKLNLKSFEAEFKVMIIWLPEKMHPSCSNKLLKLIEEPPNKTLFLLVTENEESIISTIRSRAQLIKIPYIEAEALKTELLARENISPGQAEDAVNISGGNYIKAMEYLNPGEDETFYFTKFQELMRFAYSREVPRLMDWAEEMSQTGRDRQKAFFTFALRLIREFFMMNFRKNNLVFLKKEEREWGQKFAPYINERNVILFSQEFELGIKHIAMNGSPRIIFTDTALRTVRLIKR